MTIQVNTLDVPPWKVACLRGRIDAFNDKRVFQVLKQIMTDEVRYFAVDLSQVDFMGIQALQELLKLAEKMRAKSGEFALVGPTAQVRRHLEIFAGHRGLRIFLDLEELRGGLYLRPRSEHVYLGEVSSDLI